MPFINKNPLNYPVNAYNPIRTFQDDRAPTAADFRNFIVTDEWLDTSSNDFWKLSYKDSTQGIWSKMSGTSAAAETFIPDAGTSPVVPTATNQITIVGGNGIITTGGLNQWDTSMQSPFVGDFNFENNTAATALDLGIVNNDNDPASSSALNIDTQDAGGDAFIHFDVVGGTYDYSFGIDNSDGDRFKFNTGANPSAATDIFMVDSALTSFWHYSGQLYQSNDWAGGTVFTRIQNTDNSNTGSNACLEILPGGTSGGDPYIQWQVGAVTQQYSLGIDNSVAGDPLKLTDGDSPSLGTEYMLLDIPASRWEFPINIFLQEIANVGGAVSNFVSNTDNTDAASDAAFQALTGGLNGGDPFLHVEVDSVQEYSFGIDNSDSDILKLTDGASPSAGNVLFQITAAGAPSFPTAPLDVPSGGTGVATLTDHGVLVGSGTGAITPLAAATNGQLIIGSTGADPVLATLASADSSVTITNGAGTIDLSASAPGLSWALIAVNANIVAGNGYIANKAGVLTMTLPAASEVGEQFAITNFKQAVGWQIAQGANQYIRFGNQITTVGAGGSLDSVALGDTVYCICTETDLGWQVINSVGNITVT